jgi:flagellar hook-associated protein 2
MTFRAGTWTAAAGTQSQADSAAATAAAAAAAAALTDASALQTTADATDATALGALSVQAASDQAAAQTALDADPANQTLIDDLAAKTLAASNASAAFGAATGDDLAYSNAVDADTLATTTAAAASAASAATKPSFAAASGSADVSITVDASDTVATLAAKINSSSAGLVATVFKDGTGERLLLRSKDTGEAAGFRVQVSGTGGHDTDNTGLSRLAYDPQTAAFGMASAGIPVQWGQDAKARINGLAVTSKTNTLTDNIPGVTISLTATTTQHYNNVGGTETKSPITMAIREDVTPAVKNVNDFVTAYNALNKTLADLTKYDAGTKTASLFQADSSILGLQSVLRNMLGSISTAGTYQRLSDIGMERQLDGSLSINTAKLSTAANNGTELQKLFTTDNSNALTNGFALKFAALGKGLLAAGGAVTNKATALQSVLDRNAKDQTKVNDRATAVETRLRKTYTALDTKMASLTALNSYVAQQVATWNKSSS